MRAFVLSVLIALPLAAAAQAQNPTVLDADWSASASSSHLERLFFARATDRGIQVRVASRGCTSEESFTVEVMAQTDGRYLVALHRKEPDSCRRSKPNGEILQYSREAIGLPAGAEVEFANPVRREEF